MNKLLVIGFIWFSAAAFAQSPSPSLDALNSGWNVVPTDGVCASGTPYFFYAKPSLTSENVLVFFNGGGACWFGESCDLASEPNIHFPFADMAENNPNNSKGIFDFEDVENPFRDFDIIYLPYCTGDVHIGSGVRDYTYSNKDNQEVVVTTYHNGFKNSTDVLSWVFSNYVDPNKIVVAGSSAGAVAASFYSGLVAEHYEDVDVVLIADAAGGYGSPLLHRTFSAWNTAAVLPAWEEYVDKTNQNLTFEDFYIASATHNPNLTMAQYNAAEDQTQIMFTQVIGDPVGSFSLPQRILNNYLRIESKVEDFYSYTAGGEVHMILQDQNFYDYRVDGIKFVDWVSDLVMGLSINDVSCVREVAGCSQAPSVSD